MTIPLSTSAVDAARPVRRFSSDSPLSELAAEALTERAAAMLSHLPAVRLGRDREAVHDMRVASRRLAAAMAVFRACFPDGRFAALERRARRVTRSLGKVRDQDVLLDWFEGEPGSAAEEEQAAVEYVVAVCAEDRERFRQPMLADLERLRRFDLPSALERYLRREAVDRQARRLGIWISNPPLEEETVAEAARRCLGARCDAAARWAVPAEQPAAEEAQHALRIAVKRLRYSAELFAPAFPRRLRSFLKALKKLQTALCDLHDCDVRRALLPRLARKPLSPEALWDAGLLRGAPVRRGLEILVAAEERRRARLCGEFLRLWEDLGGARFIVRWRARIAEPRETERGGVA